MVDVTTPVPASTPIGDLINGKLHGRDQLFDTAGNDAMGLATGTPAANTILGRLKAIFDAIGLTTSADNFATITPADGTALSPIPKALYVGVGGNLVVKGGDGVQVTIPVADKSLVPIRPRYVMAATTATGILGLS